MPFDAPNFGKSAGIRFHDVAINQPAHRFDVTSTRPTTQNNPLFGLDGAEWRGFFLALTAMLALVLGLSALVLAALGR